MSKIKDLAVINIVEIQELIKTYENDKTLASSGEYMILNTRIELLKNILELSKPLEPIVRNTYKTGFYNDGCSFELENFIIETKI
jgi:hypothetical protein